MSRIGRYGGFVVVTLLLGAFAGAFAWAFFFLMNAGIALLWDLVPRWLEAAGLPAVAYPLAFCLLGGAAIGLFQRRFGPYPADMNTVLAQVKATGRYDYDTMGRSFAGALLPLLFGGSIGPEAGLTGVIAGLCTWVGDRLRFARSELRDVASAGTAAVIAAIFNTPLFGLAAPLAGCADGSDGQDGIASVEVPRGRKVAVYLLAIAGALGAFAGLGALFGGGMTLPRFTEVSIGIPELAWGIPFALLGVAAGWLYHAFGALVRRVARALGGRPVTQAVIAGALLGLCGTLLPFTLFAGEAQTEQLAEAWGSMAVGVLIATGFLKVLVTQACLGLGWRGGHFFPLIFAGISIGYGAAALTGVEPVFALCACTAGLLGAVMRQPLMTALLLFLCFPVKAAFVLLVAAALGAVVPVPRRWLEPQGAEAAEGASERPVADGAPSGSDAPSAAR